MISPAVVVMEYLDGESLGQRIERAGAVFSRPAVFRGYCSRVRPRKDGTGRAPTASNGPNSVIKMSGDFANSKRTPFIRGWQWRLTVYVVSITLVLCGLWINGVIGHRLHLERYALIENGMTRADIERLLGRPPGYYATGEVEPAFPARMIMFPGHEVLEWTDNDCVVMVDLDEQGKVTYKQFVPAMYVRPRSSGLVGLWHRFVYWRAMRNMRVTGGID